MRAIVPIILFGSLVFVAILYLSANHPSLLQDIRHALGDQPAIADVGEYNKQQADRARLKEIDALLISDINKRDLREGRPFWGAGQHMIQLAMSAPADGSVLHNSNNLLYEFQMFQFGGARQPVVFEFRNNKLSCVHYYEKQTTSCNTGETSYYHTGFPFSAMMSQKQ